MIGGELVREARKRAGLTQRELAERAGVTQPAIARLESGRTSPSFEQVQRLVRLCGFDVLVELAVRDDSDRWQARDRRKLDVDGRVRSNANLARQAELFRAAGKAARRG